MQCQMLCSCVQLASEGAVIQAFPARQEASPRLLKPADWETSFVLVCERCRETLPSLWRLFRFFL